MKYLFFSENGEVQQPLWLEDEKCMKWRPNYILPISEMADIADATYDLALIPNVVYRDKYTNLQNFYSKYRDSIKNPDKVFPMSYIVTGVKQK